MASTRSSNLLAGDVWARMAAAEEFSTARASPPTKELRQQRHDRLRQFAVSERVRRPDGRHPAEADVAVWRRRPNTVCGAAQHNAVNATQRGPRRNSPRKQAEYTEAENERACRRLLQLLRATGATVAGAVTPEPRPNTRGGVVRSGTRSPHKQAGALVDERAVRIEERCDASEPPARGFFREARQEQLEPQVLVPVDEFEDRALKPP